MFPHLSHRTYSKMPPSLNFQGDSGVEKKKKNLQQINVQVSGAIGTIALLDQPSCSGKLLSLCKAWWQRLLPLLLYLSVRALSLGVGPMSAPNVFKTVLHLSWILCCLMNPLALSAAAPPEGRVSKPLWAFLVTRQGKTLDMTESQCQLWIASSKQMEK